MALSGKQMASGNIKNFELRLKKQGLIIVIVGMDALLCFTFLLGVDVGKNIDTYPEQIAALPRKVLAFIWRPAKNQTPQKVTEDKSREEDSKNGENIDLTYHNTLTSKKGVVKEQPVPDRQKIVETPAEKPVESKPQNEETGTLDLNVEAQKSPVPVIEKTNEEGKPKAKEAAPSIASHKQKFVIQAASLKEKAKASQMSKSIAALGFKSRVVEIDIKGKGIWFRVIVSGFDERAQAQAAADKIAKKIKTNCIIRYVDVEASKN